MRNGKHRKRLIDGDYMFWIVGAKHARERLHVTLREPRSSASVVKSFSLNDGAIELYDMLHASGMKVPKTVVPLDLDQLIGLECIGTITDGALTAFVPKVVEDDFELFDMEPKAGTEIPRYIM